MNTGLAHASVIYTYLLSALLSYLCRIWKNNKRASNYDYYLHRYAGFLILPSEMFATKFSILSIEQNCYICSIIFK